MVCSQSRRCLGEKYKQNTHSLQLKIFSLASSDNADHHSRAVRDDNQLHLHTITRSDGG